MRRGVMAVALLVLPALAARGTASERVLRVCADPNNLPFSNRAGAGFENRLAEILAETLGARVAYTWWPQRRGFVRNTLGAQKCDVLLGVPSDFDRVATTRPYYRSSYVFVTQRARDLKLASLDDARLRSLRIGIPLVGDDGANPPPAEALARRGIVDNVVGYPVYGSYADDSPPSRLIGAVAAGDVDVAIAWGPLAGYFARRSDVPLALTRVTPERGRSMPFTFAISLGVRHGDEVLRSELNRALGARRKEVRTLLDAYGVPRVD
jgi:mxaJ protein